MGLALTLVSAGAAPAETLNVSKIATGTQVNINFATAAAKPKVNEATLTYFTLGTGGIDGEAGPYFVVSPWSAAMAPAPTYPILERLSVNANYTQGNSKFVYDQTKSRQATVNMASASAKTVDAETFVKGAGAANGAVTYRVAVNHTGPDTLDYFVDLQIPAQKFGYQAAYNLCCSGDSNGGTYNYIGPSMAMADSSVDVYVDGLPVWSSAMTSASEVGTSYPFNSVQALWDKPNGPGASTLYLGRLSAGQSMTITLEVRAAVRGQSDCGIQPPGSYIDTTYEVHCMALGQSVAMTGGAGGAPVNVSVYSKKTS